MIIGLGKSNAKPHRRAVLITLDVEDLEHLIAGGVEINREAHSEFPDDLEILIAVENDARAAAIATGAFPDAAIHHNRHRSGVKES